MYDDSNEHELERERASSGSREGHDNPSHNEVYRNTVQCSGKDGVLYQKGKPPARGEENSGSGQCDEKVTQQAEQRGCHSAFVSHRT
jgi:hypothetical protein